MKKEKWIKFLAGIACVFLVFGTTACRCNGGGDTAGDGSSAPTQSSEEEKRFNLQFENMSVDVTQIPEGLYIDDFTLEKVTLGETVLESTEYIVRNGYFLFACEQYGALGVGTKTVKLQFAEGSTDFTLTVTDGKAPVYKLPKGKVFLLPTVGGELPALTRAYPYQLYDVSYTVKDEASATVYEKTNPTEDELTLSLTNGLYEQEIVVKKGGEVLETWEGKLVVADEEDIEFSLPEKQLMFLGGESVLPFTLSFSGEPFDEDGVVVYESTDESVATIEQNGLIKAVANGTAQINATVLGAVSKTVEIAVCETDIFSEGMAAFWQITTRLDAEGKRVQGSYGNTVWNAEENALIIEKETYTRDNSGGSMRIPVSAIEPMLALGAEYCTFEIKVNETYMSTALADTYNGATGSQMETQLVGTLGTGYVSGATMKAIRQDSLVSGEYMTVVLNIANLVNSYKNGEIDTVRIYLGGKKNSVISLRKFMPIVSSLNGATLNAGESVTLFINETADLASTLTVEGSANATATLSYKSMDESVVTVSQNGELTSVGIGNTQVLISSAEYGVSAMADISVTDGNVFSYKQNGSGWVGTMRNSKEVKRNDYGYMNQKGYWNETEGAYVMYKYGAGRDFSNGCVRFGVADTPALKALFDKGVAYVKFDIKVDETYMNSAVGNGVSAESQTKLQMAWRNADQTVNGYSASIEKNKLKAGEYVTVYFDLSQCLAEYETGNVSYVYIFLGGQELSEICLKNFGAATEAEYNAWLA